MLAHTEDPKGDTIRKTTHPTGADGRVVAADLAGRGYTPGERVSATAAAENDGFFAPERRGLDKGILGGMVMMTIAVVWFGLGWMAGYIFFYPPILFVIGLFGTLKGIFTGNVAG